MDERPSMINIAIIFGTRPEAIKMVPVIHEINSRPGEMKSTVILTSSTKKCFNKF